MRGIQKKAPPSGLAQLARQGATWDQVDGPTKQEIRERLTAEQGFLCAFCMCRIAPTAQELKVAHRVPRTVNPALSLAWQNLLAACLGGEGAPWDQQTCDTRQADTQLSLDPTQPGFEHKIRYLADGKVTADDAQISYELDQTLNLNLPRLKRNRKETLAAFLSALKRKKPEGTWSADWLQGSLKQSCSGQQLPEYLGIVEHFVRKRQK